MLLTTILKHVLFDYVLEEFHHATSGIHVSIIYTLNVSICIQVLTRKCDVTVHVGQVVSFWRLKVYTHIRGVRLYFNTRGNVHEKAFKEGFLCRTLYNKKYLFKRRVLSLIRVRSWRVKPIYLSKRNGEEIVIRLLDLKCCGVRIRETISC